MNYPQSDWPFTFFFNDIEMPRFTAQWSMMGLLELPNGFSEEPSDAVSRYTASTLQCRIDHVGIIESEDPDIFLVVAQELLLALLRNREAALANISAGCKHSSVEVEPEALYADVKTALFAMIRSVRESGHAFWTSGYQEDRNLLADFIARTLLPQGHLNYRVPPHRRTFLCEVLGSQERQATEFHKLAQQGFLPKEERRLVHDWPWPKPPCGSQIDFLRGLDKQPQA
jgi:hypothetical protein